MNQREAVRALVYVSAARTLMTEAALRHLLERARANNLREGVTGALLYCDGSFMQYIEGPSDAMDRVCAIIRTDSKHHSLVDIFSGPVGSRAFTGWTMAYLPAHKPELVRLSRADWRHDASEGSGGGQSMGLKLLLEFWDRHQARTTSIRV